MKVTVLDCLKLETLKNAKVLAGEEALGNRVKAVSVFDAVNLDEVESFNLSPNTMVITTLSKVIGNSELEKRAVDKLSNSEVSCIILVDENEGSGAVTKLCKEKALPLISLSGDTKPDYSNIITEVMEQILYGSNFKNNLINNTIFHLLNFEKYPNFEKAIKEAAIRNEFQLGLLSEDFNPVLQVETRHNTSLEKIVRYGREIASTIGDVYTLVNSNETLIYWGRINVEDIPYYLFIVDNEDNYSAGEIRKLADIIEIAIGMWKYTPERDVKLEFLMALNRGNKSLAYQSAEEAQVVPEDMVSVFFGEGLDFQRCDEIIDKYEEANLLSVIKTTEDDETYGIIIKGPEMDKKEEKDGKPVIASFFDELKEDKRGRFFHFTGFNGIEGAADGFHSINESWSSCESIFPYKRVFTKYELALVSNCLAINLQGGYIKKEYSDLLTPFTKKGDNKSKQLLDTLETFVLDAGMNASKTSEIMDIHPNTVQYRLKKINEALGVEITGNRVIPGLTVSLALNRLEEKNKN